MFQSITCLECQHEWAADLMTAACPACGSAWIDARYHYAEVAHLWSHGLSQRPHTLWRYAELLPIAHPDSDISLNEGMTPLVRLVQYERMYGHDGIFVKDERQNPSGSFKDRQAVMAVTAMHQAGIRECVLASTGNAGAAYAAYCARAGIKLWLFLTSLVPSEKMREAALYGAEVVKVSGTYDETKQVAAEFAYRRGIYLDRGAKAIPGKESMKTLGFEIAEQLGLALGDDRTRWIAPHWYIQAVSGGIGPLGVWKAFVELYTMGLIDRLPKLGIVQAAGCAPMVRAFEAGEATAQPVTPQTLITVLATGDPGFAYQQLYGAIQQAGGSMIAIPDGETFAAMRKVASKAGLSVEPATAVAFAGLEKLLSDGVIQHGEIVVVNASGHTFPAESHILGDQYVLNLELNAGAKSRQNDGLGAALQHLDEQVTTILVVDDNPHDRRLIRRLLRAHKQYRVYEAHSGTDALRMLHDVQPDLIVTDLTMPEMDGFSLLQSLKTDVNTAHIPVVVVSAKTIAEHERALLDAYSDSVWMKGDFETRQLVDHIVQTLGDDSSLITPFSQAAQTRTASSMTARSVLIIDDNRRDSRLAQRLIEQSGDFRVQVIDRGRDGLKWVFEHHPDLLLVDLMLPDLDGFAIVENIRQDAALFDLPIIVYTARELSPDEESRLKAWSCLLIRKDKMQNSEFLTTLNKGLN
jgi:threonine synthase